MIEFQSNPASRGLTLTQVPSGGLVTGVLPVQGPVTGPLAVKLFSCTVFVCNNETYFCLAAVDYQSNPASRGLTITQVPSGGLVTGVLPVQRPGLRTSGVVTVNLEGWLVWMTIDQCNPGCQPGGNFNPVFSGGFFHRFPSGLVLDDLASDGCWNRFNPMADMGVWINRFSFRCLSVGGTCNLPRHYTI